VLIAERPSDALIVKEEGLYDFKGHLVSRNVPLGAETGDIISEEGSQVIAQIPLKDFPKTKQELIDIYNKSKLSPTEE